MKSMIKPVLMTLLFCSVLIKSPLLGQVMHPYFYERHGGGTTFSSEYTRKYEPEKEIIIKNHIKSISVFEKGYKFGEPEQTGKILFSYLYDISGNKLEDARYNNGVLIEKINYKYDSQNRIIEENSNINGLTETVYDGDNYTNHNGKHTNSCTISITAAGKTITNTNYYDNKLWQVTKETYNPNGYIQNKVTYAEDGSVSEKEIYEYYMNTNLLKKVSRIKKDGTEELVFENEFDYSDPQLKVISRKEQWYETQYLNYRYSYGSDKLLSPRGEAVEYPTNYGGCCRIFRYEYDTSDRMISAEYTSLLSLKPGGYKFKYNNGLKTQIIAFDETKEDISLKEIVYSFY